VGLIRQGGNGDVASSTRRERGEMTIYDYIVLEVKGFPEET